MIREGQRENGTTDDGAEIRWIEARGFADRAVLGPAVVCIAGSPSRSSFQVEYLAPHTDP
jgi:hypothetical protein